MRLNIEKMNKDAIVPTRGSTYSAGLDLTAIDYEVKNDGTNGIVLFKTGLKMEIPEGYFGAIYMRSGLAKKGQWMLANCTGVIDSDYRGEIMIMLRFIGSNRFYARQINFTKEIKELIGTRIAQIIIQPYTNVELASVKKVKDTERSDGGFGSTGK